MKIKEQINHNIKELDFNLIHNIIKILNIKWEDADSGEKRIPTVNEIKNIAEYCMKKAFKSENGYFAIGGFEAEVVEGYVEIKYVLAKANPLKSIF